MWACSLLSQQQTLSLMLVVMSSYAAATASLFLSIICLILGSCTVRSHAGLPELMYHITYVLQSRYSTLQHCRYIKQHRTILYTHRNVQW
jgi:hypothetical protein